MIALWCDVWMVDDLWCLMIAVMIAVMIALWSDVWMFADPFDLCLMIVDELLINWWLIINEGAENGVPNVAGHGARDRPVQRFVCLMHHHVDLLIDHPNDHLIIHPNDHLIMMNINILISVNIRTATKRCVWGVDYHLNISILILLIISSWISIS